MSWFSSKTPDGWELEGCPSPSTRAEYEALAQQTLDELLQLAEKDDWNPINPGIADTSLQVQLWDRPDPLNVDQIVKTQAILPFSPKEIYNIVWNDPLERRKNWEAGLAHMELVERITEDIEVHYIQIAAPYPVATRDAVNIRCRKIERDGTYLMWGCAINHKAKPFVPKYVRAKGMTCWILKPVSGEKYKTFAVKIAKINPMGRIPGWIVNLTKKKLAEAWVSLRDHMNKYTLPLRSKEEEEEEEVQVEKQPRYEKAIQASAATSESESEEFYDTITYQSDPEVLQAVHNIEAMMQRLNDSVNKLHERLQALEPQKPRRYSLRAILKWLSVFIAWPVVLFILYQAILRLRRIRG